MAWFATELADPPFRAALGTSVLDDRGYPGERPVRFELDRDEEEPDWCRLTFEAPERELADPDTNRGWLKFLRDAADLADPSFGLIDYQYEHFGKTATEDTLGPPWLDSHEANASSREYLRGYGWVTVLARELADRLGGVEALRRTEAFCEVATLSNGGVWCLATDSYSDFDDEALLRVFLAVAPVLRPGTPRHFERRNDVPHRIVYRDAADPRTPAPPPPEPIVIRKGKLVPDWVQGRVIRPR
jgi:hypothetical protein